MAPITSKRPESPRKAVHLNESSGSGGIPAQHHHNQQQQQHSHNHHHHNHTNHHHHNHNHHNQQHAHSSHQHFHPTTAVVPPALTILTSPAAAAAAAALATTAPTTMNSNVYGNSHNTKENTKTVARQHAKSTISGNNKGLEILDFHESWLEELELYKDQLYPRKNVANHMFASHNHLHTPQGCQFDMKASSNNNNNSSANNHNINNVLYSGLNQLVNTATTMVNASRMSGSPSKDVGAISPSHSAGRHKNGNKRNGHGTTTHNKAAKSPDNNNSNAQSHNNNSSSKTVRITNHSNKVTSFAPDAIVTTSPPPTTGGLKQKMNVTQLILKRPREENTADAKSLPSNHAKRSTNMPNQNSNSNNNNINSSNKSHHGATMSNNSNHSPATNSSANARISGGGFTNSKSPTKTILNASPTIATTSTTPTTPAATTLAATTTTTKTTKSPGKFIVKQNLANSFNDRQKNYLMSNFYSNIHNHTTAATAYETSLYAANYHNAANNANNNNNNNYKSNNNNNINTHFTVVHNQNGNYNNYVGVSLADRHSEDYPPKDDPSLNIDDINGYSESDDEEEYRGHPFYLIADGTETKQSSSVREAFEEISTSTLTADELSNSSSTTTNKYYRPSCILSPSLFPNVPPYLNFSSHAERGPNMPNALHRVLKWKLSPVMPKIVKRVVLNSGFRIIKNTTDWMAIWEKHMKSTGFRTIRSHQKYNHMPGSFRIGRKDSMWRSIKQNMKKYGNKDFGFMQKSYIMPDDLENLREVWPRNASKLTKWIVKPPASARGTGIRIINKWSQFPKDKPLVVQKYIERPLLINENKFDMRIYVFLTSINPLRIYMYKDGLARFASVKYSSEVNSLDDRCMHLTNYSINKYSENYAKNEDFNACSGHKWTLQSLWTCLEERGVNTKRLWATLRNLVIKAIISGESGLNRMYRQNVNFRSNCFELFGFDVLLDENLIPWLLEINISPSLHSELPLDLHVKGPLIQAILNTALYQVPPKLTEQQQKDIIMELGLRLNGPMCFDNRIFTTCLTSEEVRKHNQYTSQTIELREEYVDSILDNLLPDDVRCILISEDELARCKPLERIFPTPETFGYLKFVENPRYYNRLLDAWESKYGQCRSDGIALLCRLCRNGYHLQVSDATQGKEPNVALTDIDMMHVKRDDDVTTPGNPAANANATVDSNIGDSVQTSKAGSPDSTQSQVRNSPAKLVDADNSAINKENLTSSHRPIPIKQH